MELIEPRSFRPSRAQGAAPDDSDMDRLSLVLFLLLFVVACTAGTTISRLGVPIYDDVAEAIAWGRNPELGYYKHPPLFGWITGLWFSVFPPNEIAAYLLGATNAGLGLWGVWRLAGRFLHRTERIAAVFTLVLSPFWTVMVTKFNANTVLLSVWPWTAFFFVRSLETRSARHGAAFGVLCAAAMLAKYVSVMLLGSCLAAALLHPDRAAYFRSRAPWMAVATAAVLLLPHAVWSYQRGFPTLGYALSKTGAPLTIKHWKGFKATLVTLLMLTPTVLGLRIALGKKGWRALDLAGLVRRDRLWLGVLALGPLTATALLGVTGAVKLAENFFTPMTFLIPTLVLTASSAPILRRRLDKSIRGATGLLASWVLVSPAVALALFGGLDEYQLTPSREAAKIARDVWVEAAGADRPVRLVAGTERYSLGLMFYTNGAPSEFTHFNYLEAPWVTPARIAAEGLLVVCAAEDASCRASADGLANPATVRREAAPRASLLFWRGPARAIVVYAIPPATGQGPALGPAR